MSVQDAEDYVIIGTTTQAIFSIHGGDGVSMGWLMVRAGREDCTYVAQLSHYERSLHALPCACWVVVVPLLPMEKPMPTREEEYIKCARQCAREVGARLSPQLEADLRAMYREGLAK